MRLAAGVFAAAAFWTIGTRVYLNMTADAVPVWTALWAVYRFFTLWTITLAGALCGWIALGGRPPAWIAGCLALAITVVAGVYHALLARLNDYSGMDWVIDLMFHTALPIAFVLLWVFVLPKVGLRWRDSVYFMAYPLIYCVYALGRGAADGVYPYGFLNVTNLGVAGVAVNVAGLVVVFVLGAALVIAVGRRLAR